MKRWYTCCILLTVFMFVFTACNDDSERDQSSSLELIATLDKTQYDLDEEVTVHIQVINHGSVEQTISVPENSNHRLAIVSAHHKSEVWIGEFQPDPMTIHDEFARGDIENIAVYTISPHETLEQTFTWNQQVLDQFTSLSKQSKQGAPSGEYNLFASFVVGELTEQDLENPLDEVIVSIPFHISGERDHLTLKQAQQAALKSEEAYDWYMSRTSDQLLKNENGAWHLHDTDGSWTVIDARNVEQFQDIAPRIIGGEREDEKLSIHFNSSLGGTPHRMTVFIDPTDLSVLSVDFHD